jgi:transmembrane sensor
MDNKVYDVKALADKLEKGTISPEEMVWFEQWYSGFDDEEVLLSGSRHTSADELKMAIFNRIEAQISVPVQPKRKVITLWRNVAAAAAVVLLVAFATLYKSSILNVVSPAQQVELLSKAGQHRQLILPDGTQVWLSPSTRISYADGLKGKQRLVKLEGEAFFDVKHDADHPFIIQSGVVKTAVLGTSFNIRAYPHTKVTEVTVLSGKVAVASSVNGKNQQQIMTPNQRAVFNYTNGLLVKEDYSGAQKFLNQRNGIFNFDGANMQVVADDLALQYGVHVKVNSNLAGKGFYGTIKTTAPITETLNKLCAVMDARWNRIDNSYYIEEIPSE